ncbi:MAG: hypothetical protein GC191_06605 [Azospirillum sp.]|nr:hypothetical protein [Azospirillum sp.]
MAPPAEAGPVDTPQDDAKPQRQSKPLSPRTLKLAAYAVYALYFGVLGLANTSILGVLIAHILQRKAGGTIFQSHFSHQIRTFWIIVPISLIGEALDYLVTSGRAATNFPGHVDDIQTLALGVGGISFVWFIYRSGMGLKYLRKSKPYDL